MRKNTLLIALSLIALVAAGTAGSVWYKQVQTAEVDGDIAAHDLENTVSDNAIDPAAGITAEAALAPVAAAEENHDGHAHAAPAAETETSVTAAATGMATPGDVHITADGLDPKSPKSIGPITAPVTMIEYSSFTCPHCANAHATVLPQLIKDYVIPGKLRIVFSDFPLNQQALDASKVSRCVAGEQYFGFQTMLFGSIEQWAYAGNHPNALIQNAVLAGLPEDKARACLADADVERALIAGVQEANSKYRVEATPTFVLNDGKKIIAGARPYAEFKAAIDALLAEKGVQ